MLMRRLLNQGAARMQSRHIEASEVARGRDVEASDVELATQQRGRSVTVGIGAAGLAELNQDRRGIGDHARLAGVGQGRRGVGAAMEAARLTAAAHL